MFDSRQGKSEISDHIREIYYSFCKASCQLFYERISQFVNFVDIVE